MTGKQSILTGMWRVMLADPDWRRHFNLRREGLNLTWLAMAATAVFYVLAFLLSVRTSPEITAAPPNTGATFFLVSLFVAGFPLVAAAIAFLQDKTDGLRAWIITRSFWALALAILIAACFALTLIGLPHELMRWPAMILFVSILLVDVRLAQVVMEQSWIFSMFTAILIWLGSILLVLGALGVVSA